MRKVVGSLIFKINKSDIQPTLQERIFLAWLYFQLMAVWRVAPEEDTDGGRPLVLLRLKNGWVGLFIVCGGRLTLSKISAST
jgi:hypothetical protein